MRLALALILALIASPVFAQDRVIVATDFTSVEVKEGVAVRIVAGPEFSVTARAVTGDVAYLDVERFGDWLVLSRHNRWLIFTNGRTDQIQVTITMPALAEVKALDHAAVTVVGFAGETLRGEAAGTGDLVLQDVTYDQLTLVANTDGVVSVKGNCASLSMPEQDAGQDNDCTFRLFADGDKQNIWSIPELPPTPES